MSELRADRNLLFGILALQMDFISRDALVTAMNAWVLDKGRSLGEILREQGKLSKARQELLESLVGEHLAEHGGDAARSLAAISTVAPPRADLEQITDPELGASLAHFNPQAQTLDEAGAADFPVTRAGPPEPGPPCGSRFMILRPHARGGLGEVFVAQDTELEREVALKEIQQRYADNVDSRSRFLLEARVTGALEHPGIVPVYGLGHYPDGRPYYAMRFIRGDSLEDAIARFHKAEAPGRDPGERGLALRELLRRFQDVCNAIAYAHDRGVLHRDLKPGNIMLGKYGETLVVDWGLAKTTGSPEKPSAAGELPAVSGSGTCETAMGRVVGTPQFMSPEQAEGRLDQLGPASDVYSLGATLYALLTGKPPIQGADLQTVLKNVRDGEFPRPRQLSPLVPPALEAICLKAMSLRPADRYATPRALEGDIERWLADEPVTAWPEPWRARLARWARRHRTAVAAAAALLITATTALAIGLVLVGQAQQETERQRLEAVAARDDANRNADAAEQARRRADANALTAREQTKLALETLKSVVFDIQRDMKDKPGLQKLREKLLNTALDGLRRVSREATSSAADADRNTGAALNDIGDIFLETGRTREALQHFESARAIAEQLVKADLANVQAQRDLTVFCNNLGDASLELGDAKTAREAYEKGLEVSTHLATAAPHDALSQRALSVSYERLGSLRLKLGDSKGARDLYQKGLALRERLAQAAPASAQAERDLFVAYSKIGDVSLALGETAAAGDAYQKALVSSERICKREPDSAQAQRDLSVAHNKVGYVSLELGDAARAKESYQKALVVRERLAEADPASTQAQRDLSVSYNSVGDVSLRMGDFAAAKAAYQKGLVLSERLAKNDPANAQAQRDLSVSYNSLGDVSMRLGDAGAAKAFYEKDLAISERLARADPANMESQRDLSISYNKVGNVSLELGDTAGARNAYEKSLAVRERLAKADPASLQAQLDLVVSLVKVAAVERAASDYTQAMRWNEKALAVLNRLEKDGKLKGQPRYAGWAKAIQSEMIICRAGSKATEDESFALAQPPALKLQLLAMRVRGLALHGQHQAAAASAGKFQETAGNDPARLCEAACLFAACMSGVKPERSERDLSAAGKEQKETYARRAVAALGEAMKAGFKDLTRLKREHDLDPLRERADFQSLVREVQAKANAK